MIKKLLQDDGPDKDPPRDDPLITSLRARPLRRGQWRDTAATGGQVTNDMEIPRSKACARKNW